MPSDKGPQKRSSRAGYHGHWQVHEKRSTGQLISATMDGRVVSWTNEYVIAVAFAGHSRVEMASTIYSTMLLMKA